MHVVPWDDPVVEAVGLDPRSAYVEMFWLPVLGPSATWLLRRLNDRLDTEPGGFDLDLEETARSLGLGGAGGHRSPFQRAILRCGRFAVVRHAGPDLLAVRRRVAPLSDHHLRRLPPRLQERHHRWQDDNRSQSLVDTRRRARRLALDLATAEEDRPGIERRLLGWGVHPAIAFESAWWAWDRHIRAAEITTSANT